MFNANLDASPAERKTLPQLRQELKKREEADRVRKPQQNPVDLDAYEVRVVLPLYAIFTARMLIVCHRGIIRQRSPS